MGISQLLPLVDAAAVDAHVSAFRKKTAAIDGYAWLHRASRTCALEMARGSFTDKFVLHFAKWIDMLLAHGVTPLVVLDGAPLPAKRLTELERRRARAKSRALADAAMAAGERAKAMEAYGKAVDISPEHARQLICELRRRGVAYIVAPYEADAQLAHLARAGLADVVITEDSDLLPFGCPAVLYKMDAAGHGRLVLRERLAELRVASAERAATPQLMFSPVEEWLGRVDGLFLDMCILAGCDYLGSMPGFGIKSAQRALRQYGSATDVVRARRMEAREPPDGGFDQYLAALEVARQTFLHQRVYDPATRTVVPLAPQPQGTAPFAHCGADLPPDVAVRLCADGDIHPNTHAPFDPSTGAAAAQQQQQPLPPPRALIGAEPVKPPPRQTELDQYLQARSKASVDKDADFRAPRRRAEPEPHGQRAGVRTPCAVQQLPAAKSHYFSPATGAAGAGGRGDGSARGAAVDSPAAVAAPAPEPVASMVAPPARLPQSSRWNRPPPSVAELLGAAEESPERARGRQPASAAALAGYAYPGGAVGAGKRCEPERASSAAAAKQRRGGSSERPERQPGARVPLAMLAPVAQDWTRYAYRP